MALALEPNLHLECGTVAMRTRWIKRQLNRRRLWKVALIVCGLSVALVLLYWHADYVLSKEIGNGVQMSLDAAWANWKTFVDTLNVLEESRFEPVPNVDCQSEPQSGYAYCNPELSPQDRATDLVWRLSLDELIDQTSAAAPGIPRVGINAYSWKSHCLHGWSKLGMSYWFGYTWTVFPSPIGLGATFNPHLIHRIGQVTAEEGRALHNLILVHFNGDSPEGSGLNCFAPNVNVHRDPRWFKAQETYGEDPLLVSKLGVAYTTGLEGHFKGSKYLKVGTATKYFPVTSCSEGLQYAVRGNVTMHDLYDTYLPAFKSQVQAGNVSQIVTSDCSMRSNVRDLHDYLLKTVLRKKFGAENVSLCLDGTATYSAAFRTRPELTAALLFNATIDIDLTEEKVLSSKLDYALSGHLITEQTLRKSVWRNFYLRIKLGDFDPPEMVPYQFIDSSHLNRPAHQTLNLQAARESIVLLRNMGNLLPLHVDSLNKLAVIGPNANSTTALLPASGGIPAFVVTVLQGLREAVNNTHVDIEYQPGCANVECFETSLFEKAIDIVHDADFVIMVMGLDHAFENKDQVRASTVCGTEPIDSLALPGCQQRLVEEVIDYNSHVILILINGGPVSIPNLYTHKGVVGILEVFYPGSLGGRAVSDVLFGRYNPGGRMPYTVFHSSKDVAPSNIYNMYEAPGQTYRYFSKEPLIPFGYGLSYSEFEYFGLDVPITAIQPCNSIKLSVSVQNVGMMEGDEVIQLYVIPPKLSGKPFIPNIQLVAFERVTIHSQAVHVASFELNPFLLSLVDEDGEHYLFPGKYMLVVTGGLENKELTTTFSMEGSVTNIMDCPAIPTCLSC